MDKRLSAQATPFRRRGIDLTYRVEDDGSVYDKNWNLKLREDNDRLYGRDWKPEGRIQRK